MERIGFLFACTIVAFVPSVACCASSSPDLALCPGSCEVLVAPHAPDVTVFAAEELTNFLAQAFSAPVPLVTSPTAGRTAIVVGTNAWSAAAGLDPTRLKRDGFILKTDAAGRRIYIAGCDDPDFDLHRQLASCPPDPWGRTAWERASLYGAYDFLERFAGVRFYFPGEIGTIVPKTARIDIPETDLAVEPDWRQRIIFSHEFGDWYEDLDARRLSRVQQLEQYRLRHHSELVRGCHGQYFANYAARFGKTHPEYFALTKDGRRLNNPDPKAPQIRSQHLCQSSRIWDEMFEDAKAYFTGRPASERGAVKGLGDLSTGWSGAFMYGKYFDVMPQDGMPKCECADCQAAYAKTGDPFFWASELVWGQTARLAQRLKDAGVKGWISQSAYASYRRLPDVEIPDNVVLLLCEHGPWSVAEPERLKKEYDEIRRWSEKVHGNMWLWTYVGKFACSQLAIPDVPMGTPRAFAEYYPRVAPHVFGVFPELGSEKFIFHHLDLYLYSRIAWDNKVDGLAVLAEYYRLMYGAGGRWIEKWFNEIETTWLTRVAGTTIDTSLGPAARVPSETEIWTKIYDDALLKRWEGYVAAALEAVPSGSMEAKRIAFMKERILDSLARRSRGYAERVSPARGLRLRAGKPNRSILRNGDFDSLDGWQAVDGADVALDEQVKMTGRASLRIRTSGKKARCLQPIAAKLKPLTKYRLSFFLRLEDLKEVRRCDSATTGGAFAEIWDNDWMFFPKLTTAPSGSSDWMYQEYEFTSRKVTPPDAFFHFFVSEGMQGTAWFDDVRIEEVE